MTPAATTALCPMPSPYALHVSVNGTATAVNTTEPQLDCLWSTPGYGFPTLPGVQRTMRYVRARTNAVQQDDKTLVP